MKTLYNPSSTSKAPRLSITFVPTPVLLLNFIYCVDFLYVTMYDRFH